METCLSTFMQDGCLGVFVFGTRCWGLNDLGMQVSTAAKSVSLHRIGAGALSAQLRLAATGATATAQTGMRVQTAFNPAVRIFTTSSFPECLATCRANFACAGIFDWSSQGVCYGLSSLGGLTSTQSRSQSYIKVAEKTIGGADFAVALRGSKSGAVLRSQRFSTA